ncbi:VPDSG-CTERM exosortase interaction domain protein [Prevotella pallens]|uniref:VPDSG-CTERM exosortase interaction domain protein n=1 Tax=Prevotella pallens TaxID=60133 RepID=UPI001CB466E1|nr:VPDSG-CTERM exosortase interaction domain protein [Prevotella pallens]MBF1478525.1 VPDSG-CTERM exosortase interaction domain protein [Prevotella pallens]
MNKKSFFIGMLSGVVLTIVALFVIGFVRQKNNEDDAVQRLEKPVSYENKKITSFKVFQVIGEDAALAKEISDKELDMYLGNTVVLIGKDFYSDQVITIKNPKRIGTYSYTNNSGMPMTVPIIEGEITSN